MRVDPGSYGALRGQDPLHSSGPTPQPAAPSGEGRDAPFAPRGDGARTRTRGTTGGLLENAAGADVPGTSRSGPPPGGRDCDARARDIDAGTGRRGALGGRLRPGFRAT